MRFADNLPTVISQTERSVAVTIGPIRCID